MSFEKGHNLSFISFHSKNLKLRKNRHLDIISVKIKKMHTRGG